MIRFKFTFVVILYFLNTFVTVLNLSLKPLSNDYLDLNTKLWKMKEKLTVAQFILLHDNVMKTSGILRREFFTVASGNHYYFSLPDAEVDKKYHVIASSIAELWQTLRVMEKVEQLINNVTIESAKIPLDSLNEMNLRNLTYAVYNKMEFKINEDLELREIYSKIKKRIEAQSKTSYVNSESSDVEYVTRPREKILTKWYENSNFKKYFVHKLFVQQYLKVASKNDSLIEQYSNLAKLIVQMAKKAAESSKVQHIYDEVISETANKISPTDYSNLVKDWIYTFNSNDSLDEVTPVLFQNLKEKLNDYLL
ncbi:hypothetical protein PGB90_003748 [Kerria lacca]